MSDGRSIVFHQHRVLSANSDNRKKSLKLYKGICANNWLASIGICQKDLLAKCPEIKEEIREKIQERAKSASFLLIRSRLSGLTSDDMVQGHAYNTENKPDEEKHHETDIDNEPQFRNRVRPISSYGEYRRRRKPLPPRPMTSVGFCTKRDASERVPELTIRSIQRPVQNEASEKRLLVQNWIEENQEHMVKPEQRDFHSFNEMRKEYQRRVKSAPAERSRDHIRNIPRPETSKQKKQMFWRARSEYHKKNWSHETDADHAGADIPGTLLRPLLNNLDLNIKHSAGCPYMCKGCFRACLASNDYLDKVKTLKLEMMEAEKKTRMPRPKFYHRKIVELALSSSQPVNKLVAVDKAIQKDEENDDK